jgi:long-chain acyl-CoA synthetase
MWAYPEVKTLGDLVRFNHRNYAARPATIYQGHSLTWQEMDELSNRVAQGLLANGVKPNDRVFYLAGNSDAYFAMIFACAKVEAAFIPANWRLSPPELAAILDDANPAMVFVESNFQALWDGAVEVSVTCPASTLPTVSMNNAVLTENPFLEWANQYPQEDPELPCQLESTMWQIYTSGTTGVPKGVELTHQGLNGMRLCEHLEPAYTWGPEDRFLFCVPSFHLLGIGLTVQAMYNASCLVIAPVFEPASVLKLINDEKPTLLGLAPVMIQVLLDHPNSAQTDFSCIREVMYAGSPIAVGLLKRALEVIPCPFMQFYGATEVGGALTLLRPEDHDLNNEKLLASCGKPLPLIEMKLLATDGTEILGANEPGELTVKTPAICKSYWNKPEAWTEVFDKGWYRTGDVAQRDENGYYYLVDRAKDMIVTGGENVYSTEVENCLSLHEAVAGAAVIGIPSEKWGEEVKALIILKPGAEADEQALITYARSKLAGYKCPKTIGFVDDFPRTGAGKISKKDLRAPFWEGQARSV